MFFMEDRFFRGLRLVLALDPKKVALGEIIIQIIEQDVIPELQKDKAREKNERKKEKLEKQIVEWKGYADRRGDGSIWRTEATKIVGALGNIRGWSESTKEDIAQDAVSKFYQRESNLKPKLVAAAKKGVKSLMYQFNLTLQTLIKDLGRPLKKHNELLTPLENTEGTGIGKTLPSKEIDLTQKELKKMRKDIAKWVKPKLNKPSEELFNLWWSAAERIGPENVSLAQLRPEWVKRTGITKSTANRMSDNWIKVKKSIAQYLEEIEGYELSPRAKKKLKISQVIGDNFIRRRFASWMLEIARAKGEV